MSDYEPVSFKPGVPIRFIEHEYPNIKYIAVIQKKTNNLVGVILYKYKDYIDYFNDVFFVTIIGVRMFDSETAIIEGKKGQYRVGISKAMYKVLKYYTEIMI